MSISNILNTRKPSISFEFFPPKTLAIEKMLYRTIDVYISHILYHYL